MVQQKNKIIGATGFSSNEPTVVRENTTYNVVSRTLIPTDVEATAIVKKDLNSIIFTFSLLNEVDNITLQDKLAEIVYRTSNGDFFSDVITTKRLNGKYLVLEWLVSYQFAIGDSVDFQLRFSDYSNTDAYIWQTKVTSLPIVSTFEVYENTYQGDYYKEMSYELLNRSPVTWNRIIDHDLPIDVKNKTITRVPSQLVVKGDTNSQAVSFIMPRSLDGIDLLTKVITIKYQNADGLSDRFHAVNIKLLESDPSKITFTWVINSRFTIKAGTGYFAIEILGYNFPDDRPDPDLIDETNVEYFYLWQTKPASITIEPSLIADSEIYMPDPDWERRWQLESKALADKLEKYVAEPAVFTPSVSQDRDKMLSWTNNYNLVNPPEVSLKAPDSLVMSNEEPTDPETIVWIDSSVNPSDIDELTEARTDMDGIVHPNLNSRLSKDFSSFNVDTIITSPTQPADPNNNVWIDTSEDPTDYGDQEVINARIGTDGTKHNNLSERLAADFSNSSLIEKVTQEEYDRRKAEGTLNENTLYAII